MTRDMELLLDATFRKPRENPTWRAFTVWEWEHNDRLAEQYEVGPKGEYVITLLPGPRADRIAQ